MPQLSRLPRYGARVAKALFEHHPYGKMVEGDIKPGLIALREW